MRTLRFAHGHIYSTAVSPFFGHSKPTKSGGIRGDIAISFSSDPDAALRLVDMAVGEVEAVQSIGPDLADVASVIEIEQRAYETGLHENTFWLDRILRGYQSRLYNGDLYASVKAQEDVRNKVIADLTPASVSSALQRLLPVPCQSRFTAVSLVPIAPFWRRLLSLPPKRSPGLTIESKVTLLATGVAVTAMVAWKTGLLSRASSPTGIASM